ncbi:hypothetical protein QBC41DRAFT_282560 [Cercophora samala]|uniref:MARVEL domain-containing protein n=1 Tax=Cercophora samala TaxID=330535 RepID=A0AA39Z7I9_9PEZI|nr:hypothetical protein QBC41DRAFT_282560 [Cercophora samala]
MSTAFRAPGREHIPIFPKGFIALRIIQLVVAVIVLGLVAYSIHFAAFNENAFMLAVAIMTIITSIYHLVAWYAAPEAFNYWAILGLDIVLVVLWLCAFAVVAAGIAPWMEYYGGALYAYTTTYEQAWWTGLAAASGMGGLEFVLHIVSLIIHSIRLHRHRKEGGHSQAGVPWGPAPTTGTVQVAQGQQQVVYAQPQQQPVVYQQVPQQQQQQQPPVYQQPQGQQVYQQPPQEKQVFAPQPQQPVPVPQQQFYQQ